MCVRFDRCSQLIKNIFKRRYIFLIQVRYAEGNTHDLRFHKLLVSRTAEHEFYYRNGNKIIISNIPVLGEGSRKKMYKGRKMMEINYNKIEQNYKIA